MPEGLLVFGDAIVSTNPAWGAGMTSAAFQAEALDRTFEKRKLRRFHADAIAATREIWDGTTGNDLGYECVPGTPPPVSRILGRYFTALTAVATSDDVVARALLRVIDHVAPMPSILRPGIVLRVLVAALRGAAGTISKLEKPAPAVAHILRR
jgi:hypothetical protein